MDGWLRLFSQKLLCRAGRAARRARPPPRPPPIRCSADQWALANPATVGAAEAWTQSERRRRRSSPCSTPASSSTTRTSPAPSGRTPARSPATAATTTRNGFVDDVHGANMFDTSANVDDDNGHGTHVTGIFGAAGNGQIRPGRALTGTRGSCPSRCSTPAGRRHDLLGGRSGIYFAVDAGAKILNIVGQRRHGRPRASAPPCATRASTARSSSPRPATTAATSTCCRPTPPR